jgi:LemA protein
MTPIYVLLGVLALLGLWIVIAYTALVRSRNRVDEAWRAIDVQLRRRQDLVPNLVETVRRHVPGARDTLREVTSARAVAVLAREAGSVEGAESRLTSALAQVSAVAERHFELRASETFRRFQAELADIENEIQAAGRTYNATVQGYNTRTRQWPTMMIAGPLSFRPRQFFKIERERGVPQVAL